MNSEASARRFRPSFSRPCMRQFGVRGRKIAPAIARCRSSRSARERTLRNTGCELPLLELEGFERFMVDFIEGGDAVIPFEQRGCVADPSYRVAIHLPNRIQHGMVVCVEDVLFEL